MANFNAARQRSRDAQRKSDLKNIQIALRLYYNDQGYYPESDDDGNIKGCDPGDVVCEWGETWSIGSTDYMSTLPSDPLDSQFYRYIRADLDTYTLSACLENRSDTNCGGNDTWCTTDMGCIYTLKP
jgi:type II secretory pathway pseudopilin PulG